MPMNVRARLSRIVLERDGHQCQLRGAKCTGVATTLDHIRPRATGGDGLDNLRAACAWCNMSRGDPRKHDPQHLPFR